MKKLFTLIMVAAVLAVGFMFVTKSSPDNPVSESGAQDAANSSVVAVDNQSKSNDHIRTAVKKQTVDKTGSDNVSISIGDFFFDPTVLKIKNGTTVTWTNNGMIGHDVKTDRNSPKQGPSSNLLDRGQSYSFTFDEPGLYLYICSPHSAQMRAVIEVVD